MFTPEPQKILIVDDSPTNVLILMDCLSEYNCISANSGEEALRIAQGEDKPDLVLLDIIMEGMDGYDVCSMLKTNSETSSIPVIFITGETDPQSLVKGFGVGGVDFITKPFNVDELKVRVSTQLKYKKSLEDNARYLKSIEDIYDTITDSMYYAQRIQNATLPHKTYLDNLMEDYFVIYKPRDIVSGDFYLVNEVNDQLLLVAADCTGHGVPGALMSMMSMAFIKEIIAVEKVNSPAQILNKLRKTIISTFYSPGTDEISDGLDASLVLIDKKSNTMKFAGANLPIYLIRKQELIEIKGNRMPVGSYPRQTPFTCHVINLQHNDCIYLFSDGFADQFGGAQNRKMMNSQFKEALLKYHKQKMTDQKTNLQQFFDQWKGYNEQVDDILLMGYRYLNSDK
ncbi:response regulator [Plebeiibacterium sediminum]|uniref:Response regulator n=1 Tax=Plebeiibacterium sediminum TaxID=2992112 RepID=A0AAE3M2R6_9BACT|nr:response regulator [Plebeiobacterium sediminum]MCW3786059.1 response regulator [Plebeiobacterium sediminum]